MNWSIKIIIVIVGYSIFSSSCNNTDLNTKTSVQDYFKSNEIKFNNLYNYFISICPKGKNELITFYDSEEENTYSISVYPINAAVSSSNPVLGGKELKLNSTELNQVLNKINWTYNNLETLKQMLKSTKCKWIRTTEINGNPVEICIAEKNWGSYSYFIFENPLTDSLIKIHGEPLNTKILKGKVILKFSAAL